MTPCHDHEWTLLDGQKIQKFQVHKIPANSKQQAYSGIYLREYMYKQAYQQLSCAN